MTTKLILNRDIEKLGVAGEVVEVKDGYARNYLVPRGFAVRWTRGAQRHIDTNLERLRKHEIASVEDAIALRDRVDAAESFEVAQKAGHNGRLFGAVTTKQMGAALNEKFGVPFDPRSISHDGAIKTTGVFPVTIKLLPEVVAKIDLHVVALD